MKPTTQSSISPRRRTLLAATVAFLAGAAFVSAQSSTSSSSDVNRDTNKPSSSSSTSGSSSSGSSYNAGSSTYKSGTGSSDVNAGTSSSTTGAGAMTGRSSMSDKLSWGDRHFVNKAADDNNDEIALAKLAADKATNSEVKSFAQKLADDHQMVGNELQTIASEKNVKIDKDTDHDRTYKRLSKKSGNEFDQEFVEHMIDEHEKAIKMFEKAAKDAKDPDVRSFASKHVDHLRDHLRQAESLRQTLMPTGRSETSTGTTRSSTSSYDTSSTPSSTTTPSSSSTSPDTSTTNPDTSKSSSSSSDTSKSSTTTPPRSSR